jgi:hypothetical protein
VVIAIVGFVAYRLRQFRREAQARAKAPGAGPDPSPDPQARPKPRSHRADKNDRSDAEIG